MQANELRDMTCCPTFILSIAGPWLQIHGFILADGPVAHPLTTDMWLYGVSYNWHIDTHADTVARSFFSLKKALQSLHSYYLNLPTSPLSETAHLLPYITSYPDESGSIQQLTYTDRIFPGGDRALFSARDGFGRNLVVKFVRKYNSEAHKLLANSKLAPTLHYAGPSGVPDLQMIVMDMIGEKNAAYLTYSGKQVMTPENCRRVSRAIELLHQSDYVFGDLRLGNILIGEKDEAYLVDFDWCGRDGIDTYPAEINDSGEVRWAEGMRRFYPMQKAHDLEMLRVLLG
jgi:hypothetical protein